MDQIIEFVNSNPSRYNGDSLRYTTAKEYRQALIDSVGPGRRMDEVFSVIQGSPFLPYWTGYYTQLPILKQMVQSSELLLGAIQKQLLNGLMKENGWDSTMGRLLPSDWEALKEGHNHVDLMQHHDAITSTSYRFVLADYQKYLMKAFQSMTGVFTKLVLEDAGLGGADGLIVGGGPYLHESILVRDADSSRSIHVDRIVDAQMGLPPVDLLVVNSLSWEVDTVVNFVCKNLLIVMSNVHKGTSTHTRYFTNHLLQLREAMWQLWSIANLEVRRSSHRQHRWNMKLNQAVWVCFSFHFVPTLKVLARSITRCIHVI